MRFCSIQDDDFGGDFPGAHNNRRPGMFQFAFNQINVRLNCAY